MKLAQQVSLLSPKLTAYLTDAGLGCLRGMLENAGLSSLQSLGGLSPDELNGICQVVRSAGFGLGHVRSLQVLCEKARAEIGSHDELDAVPLLPLRRSFDQTLDGGSDELQRPAKRISLGDVEHRASDMGLEAVQDGESGLAVSTQHPQNSFECEMSFLAEDSTPDSERRATPTPQKPMKKVLSTLKNVASPNKELRAKRNEAFPKIDAYMMVNSNAACFCSSRPRPSRQSIADKLSLVKSMPAEIVSYRDAKVGKTVEGRVPTIVLALLRLHASCSGKEVSEQRIARMALDLMEKQGYDPIRAVVSLAPDTLLCPEASMRVLGSGYCGIVFLEEGTGVAVKVMLDECAQDEYDTFCAFANASLAPRPISCSGPRFTRGGPLYAIRMDAISHTLQGLLAKKMPRGARHSCAPPNEGMLRKITCALDVALQRMWDSGCVHGDLHMDNIAVVDLDSEPYIQLIDFGNSNCCVTQEKRDLHGKTLCFGHEFDVLRLVEDICDSFDTIEEEFLERIANCKRELRELSKVKSFCTVAHRLHHERLIAGLQAYINDETLAEVESAYNSILASVLEYARIKFSCHFKGATCVRNNHMRRTAAARQKISKSAYFESDLIWGQTVS